MIVEHVLIAGLLAALAGSTLYWRRRIGTVRDALITARDWEERDHVTNSVDQSTDGSFRVAVQEAAETAGVPVEDLPDRIETYEKRVSEQASEIERLKEAWVTSWWEAARSDPLPDEGPRIVTMSVDAGGQNVVRTFAIHAMETEGEIVIASDRSSGAFAVGVSDDVTGVREADAIVDEIVSYAGGGGGGAAPLATGGGTNPEAIDAAVDILEPQLAMELQEAFGTPPNTAD